MVWVFEAKTVPSALCAGANLFSCPTCPFSKCGCVPLSGRVSIDGLCWITRVQEAPYSSDEVAAGEHTQGAGRSVREGECRAEDCL